MKEHKQIFLISDGTGITVESFTKSILSQFPNITFDFHYYPYIDTLDKINTIVIKIEELFISYGQKSIIFSTIVNPKMLSPIFEAHAEVFDLFNPVVNRLETILATKAIDVIGRTYGFTSPSEYDHRIDAINYALNCDDGLGFKNYSLADIILIGVSRCGKTPSCLYMALQFGIYAANFPLTEESLDAHSLPSILKEFKSKIFGLTITPQRLQHIRHERRPHSKYASLEQCSYEVNLVESLYRHQNIPFLDSTHYSIEEISTRIIARMSLKKRL